jgi:hypothetical protein
MRRNGGLSDLPKLRSCDDIYRNARPGRRHGCRILLFAVQGDLHDERDRIRYRFAKKVTGNETHKMKDRSLRTMICDLMQIGFSSSIVPHVASGVQLEGQSLFFSQTGMMGDPAPVRSPPAASHGPRPEP